MLSMQDATEADINGMAEASLAIDKEQDTELAKQHTAAVLL